MIGLQRIVRKFSQSIAILIGLTGPAFAAGPYFGMSISTANGYATRNLSGIFNLAASSATNTAYKITLNGTNGLISVGSITVTGAITGDVTGDITGDVTGNVTGNLTGNVTGNVTGDVTGNLTGNADTSTALAANGANCGAGNALLGVDASGAVEGCYDVATQTELDAVSTTTGTITGILDQVGIDTVTIQGNIDAHTTLTSTHGATATNTASRIILRDANASFAATTATLAGFVVGVAPAVSTMNSTGDLTLAEDADLTLSGSAGNITTVASITASGFFGDGSGLSNVGGGVSLSANNTFTGNNTFQSSVTVQGVIIIGNYRFSCPTGFTEIVDSSSNRSLGCMQTAEEGSGTIPNAEDDCFDTYGGRLPTHSEWTIACQNYELTDETDDQEWLGNITLAANHATSNSSCTTTNTQGDGNSVAYRCWIDK